MFRSRRRLGTSRLADVERDDAGALGWPRHGRPRLVTEDGAQIALAEVRREDMPAVHRAWAGRQVVVDGGCHATVVGFADRLAALRRSGLRGAREGALGRGGRDAGGRAGDRRAARRLQRHVPRDAALAPVAIPEPVRDEKLAAARQALLASPAAAEVAGLGGAPVDGYRGLVVAARRAVGGCSAPPAHRRDVRGGPRLGRVLLRRAGHQRVGPPSRGPSGALAPVHVVRLEQLRSIEKIIDVEGDGELELIGRTWPSDDVVLAGADGRALDTLGMHFYGCPC